MARQYAVDNVLDGEAYPEIPAVVTESEYEAIVEFRRQVKESCDALLASKAAQPGEPGTATPLDADIEAIGEATRRAQAMMQGDLLGMRVGDEFWLKVGNQRHFIRLVADMPVPVEVREHGGREYDVEVGADTDEVEASHLVRRTKADDIVRLIRHARKEWVKLPEEMTDFERGERNGVIFSILLTAEVPYAVAGQARPSRIWSHLHETTRLVVMDLNHDADEFAYWLLDQDLPEAAVPTQPDFTEQIREESGPVAPDTTNTWFNPKSS